LKTISESLKKYVSPKDVFLIIEPGISLAASCFSYKCSVLDTKCIKGKNLVITNGSSMHIDPQMKGRKFEYFLETKEKNFKSPKQIICGYTCIENDRFLNLENELKLSVGDTLTIKNAGAYTLSFIPLFIEYFPKVILSETKQIIREEWGINEYMQLSELYK
jgi:diaminopimelate decarboxylase